MLVLLRKDLRILRRTPVLAGLLVVYPIVIALLLGLAMSKGPGKPRVAVFDQLPPDAVQVGGARIDPGAYARQLFATVDPVIVHSRAEAARLVRNNDVLAAVIVPPDLLDRIRQSLTLAGTPRPTVEVLTSARDPIRRQYVQSTITSQVALINRVLSGKLTEAAAKYLDLLLKGGRLTLLGQHLDIAGLQRTKALVDGALRTLPPGSPARPALQKVSTFAALAIANLDVSGPVLKSIAEPITVHETVVSGRSRPLDRYAVAVAVALTLMLVAVLLGAGMLALEREEQAFPRLVRGLVSRWSLLAEKVVLAAGCAASTALLLAAGVSLFVDVSWSRVGLWLAALALGGTAFAALGVALGALTREVRSASLVAILLALPIALLALVPGGSVSGGLEDAIRVVSAVFPFRASVQALDAALNDAGGLGVALGHLAALTAGWAVVARAGLQRF